MSNRASYQRPNPNLRCGSNRANSAFRSVAIFCGQSIIDNLPFTTETMRTLASHNPEINPLTLTVAIASQHSVAGTYKGRTVSFRAQS